MLYKKYNLTFSLPDGGQKVVPFNIPIGDSASEMTCQIEDSTTTIQEALGYLYDGTEYAALGTQIDINVAFPAVDRFETIFTTVQGSSEYVYSASASTQYTGYKDYDTCYIDGIKINTTFTTVSEAAFWEYDASFSDGILTTRTTGTVITNSTDGARVKVPGITKTATLTQSTSSAHLTQDQTLKFTLADNTTKEITMKVPVAEPTALNIPCEGWGTKLFSGKKINVIPGTLDDVSCSMDTEDYIIRPIVGWKITNFTSTSSAASLDYFSARVDEGEVDMGDGAIETYEDLVIKYLDPNGTSPYSITFDVELIYGLKSYSNSNQTIYQTNVQNTLDWLATNKDFNRF